MVFVVLLEMPHPLSPIQSQIDAYFPKGSHPYARLEARLDQLIEPEHSLLDIGCGWTAPNLRRFIGKASVLRGIDLVEFPEQIDGVELFQQSVADMPQIENNSVDLAYSRSVMEHVEDIEGAYKEIYRVLKPGGRYVFITPNRYDYASIIASLVPNALHPMIVKATEGRAEHDTFPTQYKSNSRREIDRLAGVYGFRVETFSRITQYPNYLVFSRPLFWVGCQYERVIRHLESLEVLRGWIFCELVKEKN